jgi:hypothetical protein
MTDRHLRPCLSCGRPLYSLSGQRKRHPACAAHRRSQRRNDQWTADHIDQKFTEAKAALRVRRLVA